MTRMERRRRLQILVATLIIASFVSLCNAVVTGADSDELMRAEEPSYRVTTLDHQEDASFRQPSAAKSITLEMVHTLPVEDDDTIVVKAEEDVAEEPKPETEYEKLYTEQDVIAFAQGAYGEGWVTQSDTEMSQIMWSFCNRYDSGDPFYRNCDSLYDIVAQYYGTDSQQYHGYDPNNPIEERLVNLARDVLDRWSAEKQGVTDVGRTLPAEYLYFWGDGRHNHFTNEWRGGIEYDGHLGTPYDN